LTNIFVEWQRRNIEHYPIETGLGGFHRTGQRMRVIGIQKNREIIFIA
jgi:hypothetical protein